MSRFTAGPWCRCGREPLLIRAGNGQVSDRRDVARAGFEIARAFGATGSYFLTKEAAAANALLIAAAPDLLEACRAIVEAADCDVDDSDVLDEMWFDAAKKARAAIAKAEG